MRVLPGTPDAAGTGWKKSRVTLMGSFVVRAITVSNFVGDERLTLENAKIIAYDTPDARQHGALIKNGQVRGLSSALAWTGELPITDGAIQGFVFLTDSAQVGMFVVVDD